MMDSSNSIDGALHPHTHTHTHDSGLHATAASAFRALCATMEALVFFNTTTPCDEKKKNKSETETSRHLFVSQWRLW